MKGYYQLGKVFWSLQHLLEGLDVQLAFNTFGFAQLINFFCMLLQQLLYSFLLKAFLSFLELQLEIKM